MKELAHIFGSYMKAQEITLLLHDVKAIVRQGFYEPELDKITSFCRDNNLFVEVSQFKVLLLDECSYSNKGVRVETSDPREGMYFVYISKDEKKSLLAAYYELMQSDQDLGLLLGYPHCCVRYFCNAFSSSTPNPQHSPTNAWTNITMREKDKVLLSHFPCSSDCEQSIQLAKTYFTTLKNQHLQYTYTLLEELKNNL